MMRMGILLSGVVGLGAAVGANVPPLMLLVNVREYFSETYTRRPPHETGALFVYFVNEPVRMRLEIANRSDTHETLLTAAAHVREAVRVRTFHNGEPADIPVSISADGWRTTGYSETPLNWERGMGIGPRGTLKWHVEVLGQPLKAGFYRLEFGVLATDEQSRPIAPQAPTFQFEVREPSTADEPEILRRDAMRLFGAGRYPEAERAVTRLLQRHPSSYEAHLIRGQIQVKMGRPDAAAQHFARALALLEPGADSLFIENSNPFTIEHTIQDVRAMATPRR